MATLMTRNGPVEHAVVGRDEWLAARRELLEAEKAFFREHDRLKERRRALPWMQVKKRYEFAGPRGKTTLRRLFGDSRQLLVYHFMFNPEHEAGCPHCSFWADHYDGPQWHLAQRDTRFVAISRAPTDRIRAFKQRMGWRFPWYSSGQSDFNYDFGASFTPEQIASGQAQYNYAPVPAQQTGMVDREGLSAFYKDETGRVYLTYATFARGIDLLNSTYNLLDLSAKGRDEDPAATQSWVRHHDRYDEAPKG